jgi:glycosyltransferase involved in cell wall biosynthesis
VKICLLPTDTWGVGSYRTLFPGRELERRGHEVFAHLDKAHLARWEPRGGNTPLANLFDFNKDGTPGRTFDADTYVFQRRMEQLSVAAIRQLRRLGKLVVGEVDDNYDFLPPSSPGWKTLRERPDRVRVEWLNEGLSFCDRVTVSTPALAEHYRRYNTNIRVLPNYLDWEMWENVQPQYEVERPRVRVGWMGWLEWRGTDLEQLRAWIGPWLRRHPEAEFVSVGERHGNAKKLRKLGHLTVHDYLGVPKEQRATVKAAPFHELAKITATIDIGLVPLAPGAFNECKSYLKGLEYSACGVVPVASPTQQYREFIRDGEDGYLVDTPAEWAARLDELVADDELRRRMGAAARAKAETMTVQRHWRIWEAAWSSSTLVQARTASQAGSTLTMA